MYTTLGFSDHVTICSAGSSYDWSHLLRKGVKAQKEQDSLDSHEFQIEQQGLVDHALVLQYEVQGPAP